MARIKINNRKSLTKQKLICGLCLRYLVLSLSWETPDLPSLWFCLGRERQLGVWERGVTKPNGFWAGDEGFLVFSGI